MDSQQVSKDFARAVLDEAVKYANSYSYGFDPKRGLYSADTFIQTVAALFVQWATQITEFPSRASADALAPENRSLFEQIHQTETLRDRFAMAALAGFGVGVDAPKMAALCYEVADAMLEARKRVQESGK